MIESVFVMQMEKESISENMLNGGEIADIFYKDLKLEDFIQDSYIQYLADIEKLEGKKLANAIYNDCFIKGLWLFCIGKSDKNIFKENIIYYNVCKLFYNYVIFKLFPLNKKDEKLLSSIYYDNLCKCLNVNLLDNLPENMKDEFSEVIDALNGYEFGKNNIKDKFFDKIIIIAKYIIQRNCNKVVEGIFVWMFGGPQYIKDDVEMSGKSNKIVRCLNDSCFLIKKELSTGPFNDLCAKLSIIYHNTKLDFVGFSIYYIDGKYVEFDDNSRVNYSYIYRSWDRLINVLDTLLFIDTYKEFQGLCDTSERNSVETYRFNCFSIDDKEIEEKYNEYFKIDSFKRDMYSLIDEGKHMQTIKSYIHALSLNKEEDKECLNKFIVLLGLNADKFDLTKEDIIKGLEFELCLCEIKYQFNVIKIKHGK